MYVQGNISVKEKAQLAGGEIHHPQREGKLTETDGKICFFLCFIFLIEPPKETTPPLFAKFGLHVTAVKKQQTKLRFMYDVKTNLGR